MAIPDSGFLTGRNPFHACTVTCDANGNITEVDESELGKKPTPQTNYLYSYFTYDALNRLTEHKTKAYVAGGTNAWVWTRRTHAYDALGRLVESGYRSYNDGGADPGPANHSHAYSGSRPARTLAPSRCSSPPCPGGSGRRIAGAPPRLASR